MAKPRAFSKVAIANRGEVAVRIIRACQELGLETLLLHSQADANSLASRLADEKACVGEAAVAESYLNIESNIQHALSRGADAIHPGFGFLSENAEFAQACIDNGLSFIGPSAESIRLFGDKISAKELVIKTGVPTVPGYDGKDQSLGTLLKKVEEIGYPAIVKAAAGGGGRGLKVILGRADAREKIESAQREGQAAFGSSRVFLEKYLDHARHIEVQIFGDASGKVYQLGERECSVQRRHQKIIEEALASNLDLALRDKILAAAIAIGEQAEYRNAGTVEFLVQDDQFYFMEMNTRLQVEHPVTELVMGVDLVKAQILTAMGQAVHWDEISPRGHAIECRIYAEDPYQGGIPSTGRLEACLWPHGPGRRFEVGIEAGDEVTPYYDSMIAKIVVWDESRARAIQKMRRTLSETIIFGLNTNIPLLEEILSHPEFIMGQLTTRFFETHFSKPLERLTLGRDEKFVLETIKPKLGETNSEPQERGRDPWTHTWGQR